MLGSWEKGHGHIPILRLPSHTLPSAGERRMLPAAGQQHPAEPCPSATRPPPGTCLSCREPVLWEGGGEGSRSGHSGQYGQPTAFGSEHRWAQVLESGSYEVGCLLAL